MFESFTLPILISTVAGAATIFGFLASLYAKARVKKYSHIIVSIAAGVLLGTAFAHLLPESFELIGEDTFLWVLGGFVLFFLIEAVVGFHACQEDEHDDHTHHHVFGTVAGAGIFFHSILDGVAIGIGHEIDPSLGIVTAIAVMVHEFPEGIFTFSILLHNKMKIKKAMWWTIAVALATPVGTLLTLLLFPELNTLALGKLLAIAAGSFIYISASDLIPESHKSRSIKVSAFLLLGVAFSLAINSLIQ